MNKDRANGCLNDLKIVTKRVKHFWENESLNGVFSSGYKDHNVEEKEWKTLKNACVKYIPDFTSIRTFEIGCHVGFSTNRLYNFIAPNRYKAIDISQGSINAANQFKNSYNFSKVEFQVASATDIPQSNRSIDVVFSLRCIQNITDQADQEKVLLEIYRILVSGGKVFLVENWQEDLDRLNNLRKAAGLEKIQSPPHTRFLQQSKMRKIICERFTILEEIHFTSAYYFGTRFVKWLTPDSQINNLKDLHNEFYLGLEQENFKIKLGPSLLILQKKR